MKKLSVLTVIMLLGFSLSSHAQLVKFGLRAGLNVNDFSLSSDLVKANNMVGFQVGPVVDINLLGFGVEAGVLYNQKGAKIEDEETGEKTTFRNSYLDIPINLKYNVGLMGVGLYAAVGPYFSFALDGKKFGDAIDAVGDFTSGDIDNFDIGLNFGIGAKVSKIGVGVQYGLGLKEAYEIPKSDVSLESTKVKNRGFSVLLTYYF
ncbi:MAG: PorT family protein [Candidatus Azobacteroides sp.]|nr:PorT family protein [Candidatus Azobacteroides sp.]